VVLAIGAFIWLDPLRLYADETSRVGAGVRVRRTSEAIDGRSLPAHRAYSCD
jgi:hypothetical protein